jgi:predicted GIY-YIG superfamily endonuclease
VFSSLCARPELVEGYLRALLCKGLNMQNHFYMYILKCVNGAYYVGHTDNIDQRMSEHNLGLISSCYTKNKRPVELVFLQDFPTRDSAFNAERQIKGWSRKKKEAFIRGDWEEIKKINMLQKNE